MKTDNMVMLSDVIEFNPRESLAKGMLAPKIGMEALVPHCKKTTGYSMEEYKGGAKFRNGDTVMARITPCLENGKTAYIDSLPENAIGFGSTEYIVMRAKPGKCIPEFVYYLACSDFVRLPAIKSMAGSSGRQRVQQDVVEKIEINLPPLSEQERVVEILGTIDAKIDNNSKKIEELKRLQSTLFNSWFVNFSHFNDQEFVLSDLGMIPEGWSIKLLNEVTTNIREKAGGTEYPVFSAVNTGNLQLSEDYFSKQVFSKDTSKYIVVRENDFAYNPARVNIGSIGKNDFGYVGCVSPVYVVFRTEDGYSNYFERFVKSARFKEEVITRATGSVRQSMNYSEFGLIQVAYPPKYIVAEFNGIYDPITENIEELMAENENLQRLLMTLLPEIVDCGNSL